jgi:UDP-N-acetylglucosamine diphosphorylase/glucosamine-1-phosphate N-acetyltransferase
MNICIFEDKKYKNFYPLTLSRPVFELRTGTRSIREKIVGFFPHHTIFLRTRPYLRQLFQQKLSGVSFDIPDEPMLFINGRILPQNFLKEIESSSPTETLYFSNNNLIAASVNNGNSFLEKLKNEDFEGYHSRQITVNTIEYPWELLTSNGKEIENEFQSYDTKKPDENNITLINKQKIYCGENITIMPYCVLDAENGPIIIDNGTKIMSGCLLKGPLYIGKNCLVKNGAKIYGPTSIGNVSKVAGEIASSIIQGYSNKQHDGFIGHSYIGEWVNIGAGTNNSNLKNNYKEVTVYINNKPVNTGLTFFGSIIGDHSKIAINTMLNTGTVIGFSVNIFGEGFPRKYIPSFSWGGKRKFKKYKLEDAIQTARLMMDRRDIELTDEYEKMMRKIFDVTEEERHYGT